MPLTLKEFKKEKLDHFYFLTKGYAEENFKDKKDGKDVVVKFDVVANSRIYQNDIEITDKLKEFLEIEKLNCFRTKEEAENAKERRTG